MKSGISCIILFLSIFACEVHAQSLRVTDEQSKPLSGVQLLKPGGGFLISDYDGRINTSSIKNGEIIMLKSLGYYTDTLSYSPDLKIHVLKEKDYDLDEVVITGQYRPVKKSQSVHAIKTITAKEIENHAAINLRDVLQNELNSRVSRDNILGSGLSMQGLSGQNVKIMIDGVPVIGRLDGNIDLSQLNLNNVERIEIVQGPLAVNYGTNALAGTINLITKRPKTNQVSGGAEFYTESSGHYNTTAHASLGLKNHSFRFSGGRNFFDGWNPGDNSFYHQRTQLADEGRFQQWKPREQYFADLTYRNIFDKGYFELAGSWYDDEITNRGRPRGAYRETALDDIYKTLRYSFSAKVQTALGDNWNTHHLVAYNLYRRTKSTYTTDLTGVNSQLSENESLQDTTAFNTAMARGSFIGKLSQGLNLQLGYEVEVESAEGKRIEDETGQIENYAVFATAEWRPFPKFTVKPGLRATYNSRYGAPVVPSLNLLYKTRGDLQARLSYAQGFRSPGLKELSFYFVDVNHNIQGSPDLNAEKSHNVSASLSGNKSAAIEWSWSVHGFYNKIYNLITLAQTESTEYTYVNIGEQQTLGGRAEAEGTLGAFNISAGFSYTGVENEISREVNGQNFIYTPEATARAGYVLDNIGLRLNLIYKFTGRRTFFRATEEAKPTEEYIEAYQNFDAILGKKFLNERLSLEIGAKNLFDVQNINATVDGGAHSGGGNVSIATGRTYFARLSLSLNSVSP